MLHELLCGPPLFAGASEWQLMTQHVNATPTPLRQLRAEVPAELETLVLHLLHKAPEARPADVQEVYERLRPLLPAPGEEPTPQEAGLAGGTRPDRDLPAPVRAPLTRRYRRHAADGVRRRARCAARRSGGLADGLQQLAGSCDGPEGPSVAVRIHPRVEGLYYSDCRSAGTLVFASTGTGGDGHGSR